MSQKLFFTPNPPRVGLTNICRSISSALRNLGVPDKGRAYETAFLFCCSYFLFLTTVSDTGQYISQIGMLKRIPGVFPFPLRGEDTPVLKNNKMM